MKLQECVKLISNINITCCGDFFFFTGKNHLCSIQQFFSNGSASTALKKKKKGLWLPQSELVALLLSIKCMESHFYYNPKVATVISPSCHICYHAVCSSCVNQRSFLNQLELVKWQANTC